MATKRHLRVPLAVTLVLLAVASGGAATAARAGTSGRVTAPRQRLSLALAHAEATRTGALAEPIAPSAATGQELAALLEGQEVLSQPSVRSVPVSFVAASRPITGERTVLPVIGSRSGTGGQRWLEVMVPGRPNGRTGWIHQSGTVLSRTRWHIVVETARRRVIVYDGSLAVRTFVAIVGKPATPTPLGRFFVEEVIALPGKDVGAPYALALSARSNVLQEFDGGPGQIGLHGLGNIGGVLGTAVSHGCVRVAGAAMRWIVAYVTPGVVVTITK